ncbi:MAG: FHA domain-containing protein [Acidobacteriota bacterium]|nr:MAG: FHA domain-containing protein [Acidobacteriota bacterium]
MINCPTCNSANSELARFCDNCGTRLTEAPAPEPAYQPPPQTDSSFKISAATSLDIPNVELQPITPPIVETSSGPASDSRSHATLVIERGDSPGTNFELFNEESMIGRWDADNGIFPDVDLDAHDSDAKVSRRHAKIYRSGGAYFIEDLGSTNGTYVNRGRRLLPGTPHIVNDNDEIIVGKTFLRFHIVK